MTNELTHKVQKNYRIFELPLLVGFLLVVTVAFSPMICFGQEAAIDSSYSSQDTTVRRMHPERRDIDLETYKRINKALGEQFSKEQIANIYVKHGDVLFKQANIDNEYQGRPFIVSFPVVKEGQIRAVLIAYMEHEDQIDLSITPVSIFEMANEALKKQYGEWTLPIMSMFSRHAVFMNLSADAFQAKLQNYYRFDN